MISQSQVNPLKWACMLMQAVCALIAIAIVHSDNRLAAVIALGIFATGVAASLLLILAHDRPFTGEISIKSDPLLQVVPGIDKWLWMRLLPADFAIPTRSHQLRPWDDGRFDRLHCHCIVHRAGNAFLVEWVERLHFEPRIFVARAVEHVDAERQVVAGKAPGPQYIEVLGANAVP